VLAHNRLDGLGSLIGVVEWDGRYKVMENVCLNNAVEKGTTDKAKFAIDGSSSPTGEVPGLGVVVRKSGIGVL
jgi:hypothetical protein